MYSTIIAFVLATIAVSYLPVLPDARLLWIFIILGCLGFFFRRLAFVSGFVLGVAFALNAGHLALNSKLPLELQGKDLLVEGYVYSLPEQRSRSVRFQFSVTNSAGGIAPCLINVSWYTKNSTGVPKAGETWRLVVRLNRPHGSVNPGLFDYEGWLLASGISATGYVREDVRNERVKPAGARSLHHQVREKLRELVSLQLPDDPIRGVLLALMIGESSQIDKSIWRLLSDTGTNHLLIISGLHVGLVAAIALGFCRILFRPAGRYSQIIAGLCALVLTMIYGSIAGLGLPVQRALVMVAIGAACVVMRRSVSVWLMLSYALLMVTVVNPFASLGAGYWLSFGAVATLIFSFSGRRSRIDGVTEKVMALLKTQWVVFVAMAPLLICWVMQFSLVAFIVNLIAIPFIAVVIVPTLLLCEFLLLFEKEPGFLLLGLVHHLLGWFIEMLRIFGEMDFVFREPGSSLLIIVLAFMGSIVLLFPRGLVPRWLGMVFILPLITPVASKLPLGDVVMTVLDVGQGLSVVIKTRNHVVVYDAGPYYGTKFDAGEQIVAPTVRLQGSDRIHTLVVSHSDIDHAGGVEGLERQLPITQKLANAKVRIEGDLVGKGVDSNEIRCKSGQRWQLDEVRFRILLGGIEASDNNQSCVLLVQAGDFAFLLPGDIESFSEQLLAKKELPFINVMVAPHHGSLSSSTPGFLNEVKPDTVIVSAGYLNRFRHPHPRVIARYRARDIKIFNTATGGAIVVTTQGGLKIETARSNYRRFWHDSYPDENRLEDFQ